MKLRQRFAFWLSYAFSIGSLMGVHYAAHKGNWTGVVRGLMYMAGGATLMAIVAWFAVWDVLKKVKSESLLNKVVDKMNIKLHQTQTETQQATNEVLKLLLKDKAPDNVVVPAGGTHFEFGLPEHGRPEGFMPTFGFFRDVD